MAYCRFSDGDVYLYHHCGGFIECCACSLANEINTIFTKGTKDLPENDMRRKLFGDTDPCEVCNGEGCALCMMHGNTRLDSFEAALQHLKEHVKAGHIVPDYAFTELKKDITDGVSIL